MRLNSKQLSIVAISAIIVFTLIYVARVRTDRTGQPRYESPGDELPTASFGVIDALDTGNHYFHPAYCVPGQTQIFTPHKYPNISGGNISTLIHQGMDALRRPAPQDDDWRVRPPGEEMW